MLFYDYPALNSSHIFYDEKQYSTLIASMDFRALLIESSPASSESMGRNPKTSGTLIPLFVEMGENNNVYLRWISVPIKQTLSHSKSNVSVSCYVLDVISLSTHLISFLHFNHVWILVILYKVYCIVISEQFLYGFSYMTQRTVHVWEEKWILQLRAMLHFIVVVSRGVTY